MKSFPLFLLCALPLAGCATSGESKTTDFAKANSIMAREIETRIQEIPYQHREKLFANLLWLSQTGEQAIPALLTGLQHAEPKVRSSCAWVLGRIGDRRTIPDLQRVSNDKHETVRLEVARTLVEMGDMKSCPALIVALDSDKVQVRGMCHEALKRATARDFGYDHLSDNVEQRRQSVLRWRQWWGTQTSDQYFAQSYAETYHLSTSAPAMPNGEGAQPPVEEPAQVITTEPLPENPQDTKPASRPVPKSGKSDGTEPK